MIAGLSMIFRTPLLERVGKKLKGKETSANFGRIQERTVSEDQPTPTRSEGANDTRMKNIETR